MSSEVSTLYHNENDILELIKKEEVDLEGNESLVDLYEKRLIECKIRVIVLEERIRYLKKLITR